MNFLFKCCAVMLMTSNCFGAGHQAVHEGSIAMYNRIKTGAELADFIFAFDRKHTAEDQKLIAELKANLQNEILPKASLSGQTILIGKNNIKVEIVSATSGEYLINEKIIKLSPLKPLKITFKEIENALSSKQSKFEFFFINQAEAAGPLLVAAAAVYGLGALVTGGGCAALGTGFGGTSKETLMKTARVCSELAVAWPYAAWSLYDDLKNGNEIIEGSCEKNGPENKFGNLVKLRTRDDFSKKYMEKSEKDLGLYKKEYYFQTDEKAGKVRAFTKGYDAKNQTYNQVYEQEAYELLFVNINDQKNGVAALKSYIKNLENICTNGGTSALNQLIKSDSKISKGLINIAKIDSSKNQSSKPAQTLNTNPTTTQ